MMEEYGEMILFKDGNINYASMGGFTFRIEGNYEDPNEPWHMLFVAIYKERGSTNHFRILDVETMSLTYAYDLKWKDIYTLLKAVIEYKDPNYVLYSIRPKTEASLDWIKSYMPLKRSRINAEVRKRVYAKCDGHCAYCGKKIKIEEMQVDHVVSHYRHKGKDDITNYLPACRDCNGLKSDFSLEEFRDVLIPSCAKHSFFQDSDRASRICKAYKLNMFRKGKIVFYFEKENKNG